MWKNIRISLIVADGKTKYRGFKMAEQVMKKYLVQYIIINTRYATLCTVVLSNQLNSV